MPRAAATTSKTRSRGWCFTMYRTDEPVFNESTMTYMVYQREKCPSTGREHWQGYVHFKSQKTMAPVKTALNDQTVHLEKANGTPEENRAYCTKDDTRLPGTTPTEHGIMPQPGKRNDLIAVANAINDGMDDRKLCKEFPESMIKYGKGIQTYRQIMQSKGPRKKKTWVAYISGPAGCGKSMTVNELYPDAYPKDGRTKWWDNYYCQDVVNMDDFYGIDKSGNGLPLSKMLNIMDRYPVLVEPKGRTAVDFNSDALFITSNVPPEDLYKHLTYEWLTTFRRRIDFEYRYVGDDYDVSIYTAPGWYARTFNGSGVPASWTYVGKDQEQFMAHVAGNCPVKANIIEDEEEEDSQATQLFDNEPLPNAAEYLAVEALSPDTVVVYNEPWPTPSPTEPADDLAYDSVF